MGFPTGRGLLGLGEDGHTASLFPGAPRVLADGAFCLPVRDALNPARRVTLSLPVLRAARHCLLLATGAGKADRSPRCSPVPTRTYLPVCSPPGRLQLVIDDAAAPPSPRDRSPAES
jgi:6-phosphogluconolactonase